MDQGFFFKKKAMIGYFSCISGISWTGC